jgi:hypothetical protein
MSGSWNDASRWTASAAGTDTPGAWVNDAGSPRTAVWDFSGNVSGSPAPALNIDLNLGGLTVSNVANLTGSAFFTTLVVPNGAESRNVTFGTGSVVNVSSNALTVNQAVFRSLSNSGTSTTSLTIDGGFTKTGAGSLGFIAQTSGSSTPGQSASLTINGVININEGAMALNTTGVNTRSFTATGATLNLATGTSLRIGSASGGGNNGNADIGIVTGSGTILGEAGSGSANSGTVTIRPTGLTPGTDGTIGTLTVTDLASGNNSWGANAANALTAFSFATISAGGLSFDLGAPGTSDQLAFSGLSTVNLASIGLSHFTLNPLDGFGTGTYTLMTGLTSISGSLGAGTTGTIGGLDVTLSIDGSNLVLTAIPEPSAFAALAGLGMLGFAATRRRRAASA